MRNIDLETLYELFLQSGGISTDTRKCIPNTLFFALKGENFNGNHFALHALQSGCTYAIVDEEIEAVGNPRVIKVDHCLQTLQQLAALHRRRLGIRVIGITGTNGKTTTKELTAACLSRKYNILYTQGNLNNQIGVPLTLLQLTRAHELAIIEMGASHPGDIRELVEIAQPDYGLITNVGKAHLQGFGSFEGVIDTKCELYDYIRKNNGTVFVHNENKYLMPRCEDIPRVVYGEDENLYVSGKIIGCAPFLSFSCSLNKGKVHTIDTQLIGSYNLTNALAAAAIASYFDVDMSDIAKAIAGYTPENKRSQLYKTSKNTLILDTYNANPTSMAAALDNFDLMTVPCKAVLLGNMGELGSESENEHEIICERLQRAGYDKIILVGSEFEKKAGTLLSFPDTQSAIMYLQKNPLEGFHILIKGSRSMKLEQCIDYL